MSYTDNSIFHLQLDLYNEKLPLFYTTYDFCKEYKTYLLFMSLTHLSQKLHLPHYGSLFHNVSVGHCQCGTLIVSDVVGGHKSYLGFIL